MILPLSRVPKRFPATEVIDAIGETARARRHKGLLVYVHVPFCSSKCHFCDWVTRYPTPDLTSTGDLQSAYVQALCRQIHWYGPKLRELGYVVTDVYWGGGTPTRLHARHIAAVGAALAGALDLSRVQEYTVECSPETLTRDKLEALLDGGANRLSIGVQSFDGQVLHRMGRAHDAGGARRAIALVQSMGVENFNVDLITGFADQGLDSSVASVQEAIDLGIPHLSIYLFRSFDASLVSVRQVVQGFRSLDVEHAADCLDAARRTLAAAGYDQYAIASYAREARFHFDADQHYYTHRGDFIGFGAGAESFLGRHSILQATPGGPIDVRDYVADPLSMGVVRPASQLATSGAAYIRLLQALSTRTGIVYDLWEDHLGIGAAALRNSPPLVRLLRRIEAAGGRIVETAGGLRLDPETAADAINRFQAEEQTHAPLRV